VYGGYDRTTWPYRVYRLHLRRRHPVRAGCAHTVRPCQVSNAIQRLGRGKPKSDFHILSLSFSSKPQINSTGSSKLFVFYSIPRTPSNYGTFLLRSPTYFPRIQDLAFAINNLDLGLIMNFITLMSMLDFEIRGDSFVRCVEDDHMSISI
jgi:hypothetical protein